MTVRERTDQQLVSEVAAHVGAPPIDKDWSGVDAVLPLLERMRAERAIVVIKWDGERGPNDNGPYTALISGPPVAPDFFRIDAHTLEGALAYVIVSYAVHVWGYARPR